MEANTDPPVYELSNCLPVDEGGTDTLTTKSCVIPFKNLRKGPFNLVRGSQVNVRVAAINFYGQGPYSEVNLGSTTVQVKTEPAQMAAVDRESTTTTTQIAVSWTTLINAEDTGGSSITSYELEWDSGTVGTTWTTIYSNGQDSSHTQTDGVVSGTRYQFRV